MRKDYYEILGVSRNASIAEIKDAFRELALRYHPDRVKSHDGQEKFKEVSEAYSVLSNYEKREQYDQFERSRIDSTYSPEEIYRAVDVEDVSRDHKVDIKYVVDSKASKPHRLRWAAAIALIVSIMAIAFGAIWYVLGGSEKVAGEWAYIWPTLSLSPDLMIVIGVTAPIILAVVFVVWKRRRSGPGFTHGIRRPRDRTGRGVEYCYHCGASMPMGARFCKKCGNSQA
jgi:hypothetical protein